MVPHLCAFATLLFNADFMLLAAWPPFMKKLGEICVRVKLSELLDLQLDDPVSSVWVPRTRRLELDGKDWTYEEQVRLWVEAIGTFPYLESVEISANVKHMHKVIRFVEKGCRLHAFPVLKNLVVTIADLELDKWDLVIAIQRMKIELLFMLDYTRFEAHLGMNEVRRCWQLFAVATRERNIISANMAIQSAANEVLKALVAERCAGREMVVCTCATT